MPATVRLAVTGDDYRAVTDLMTEYVRWLPFELTFQDFAAELDSITSTYGGTNGAAFLVEVDGRAVGVCGVSQFEPGVAELKRMYLQEPGRGRGLGRLLADHAIAAARRLGYRRMRLDTVDVLEEAIGLYRSLGFVEIDAYRHNPQQDARFFELDITEHRRPDPIGVVLTGGSSRRMGSSKAQLVLGGRTLSEHVADAIATAGVAVVPGDAEHDPPGLEGPLAGLVGAMRRHPGADVFLSATDQPYLRTDTVVALLASPGDVVAPLDERPQTMCAVYRDTCLPQLERLAATDPAGSLQRLVSDTELDVTLVGEDHWRSWGEDGRSWRNLNTPEDFGAAETTWPEPPARNAAE